MRRSKEGACSKKQAGWYMKKKQLLHLQVVPRNVKAGTASPGKKEGESRRKKGRPKGQADRRTGRRAMQLQLQLQLHHPPITGDLFCTPCRAVHCWCSGREGSIVEEGRDGGAGGRRRER